MQWDCHSSGHQSTVTDLGPVNTILYWILTKKKKM